MNICYTIRKAFLYREVGIMKYLFRALWLLAAFLGGVSLVGIISALLAVTKKKYYEV